MTSRRRGEKLDKGRPRIYDAAEDGIPVPAFGKFFPQERQGLLVCEHIRVPQVRSAALQAIELVIGKGSYGAQRRR